MDLLLWAKISNYWVNTSFRPHAYSGSGTFRPKSISSPRRFAPRTVRPWSVRPWTFRPPNFNGGGGINAQIYVYMLYIELYFTLAALKTDL